MHALSSARPAPLSFITVAHEPEDLGAGRHAMPRPMLIQCRPSRRRRRPRPAAWWVWPTSWAMVLTFGYLVSDSFAGTVTSLIVQAGF